MYRDYVISINKVKLLANLGAKLFQEAGGLFKMARANKRKKEKKIKIKTSEVDKGAEGIAKKTKYDLACNRSCHLTQI